MKPLCPYCSALWTLNHECDAMVNERVATLALDLGYVLGDEPPPLVDLSDPADDELRASHGR